MEKKNSILDTDPLSFNIDCEFAAYLAIVGILDYTVVKDLSGEFIGVIRGKVCGRDLEAKIYVRNV